MDNILIKYMKANYNSEDFRHGKNNPTRKRIRRRLKKMAKRLFNNDFNKAEL